MSSPTQLFRDHLNFSALDNDFYKMNMWQCFMHQYPYVEDAEYKLVVRSDVDLRPYREEIEQELENLNGLQFTDAEIQWLSNVPWYTKDFIEWVRMWSYQTRFLTIGEEDGQLSIRARGPLMHINHFEMPVLSTISEVYHRNNHPEKTIDDVDSTLLAKTDWLKSQIDQHKMKNLTFADFGTRRRFSATTQQHMINQFKKLLPGIFTGTSNMYYAKEMGLTPIGTMAHEIFMLSQQIGVQLANSQKHTLECWVKEFRGRLGCALTDVIGMDAFVRDFDLYFAKLFDGLRHDSGDPKMFGDKAIKMYEALNIDPMTKTLVFSDGLNFQQMVSIYRYFEGRIKVSFGIGTYLSCDLADVKPLNIVMKLVHVNGRPVAKISDAPGKNLCEDEQFVDYLKKVYRVTWA
ncbi:nicotinate phosphoribosyltransferase [Celerinatantimonas diazotrophica]|uniref:Nicotinate phosphoribosyltransferase n=1 Tax=Celerinatantimonas diazotrophica TaxID=412034 RepID=A0A4R1JM91_9GAMM|nr:nicotinate phosphoribosyltransferase [Celerinatantimonas diazotrophica]TCK52192.1 nicotinate phosphoribosyltransferase [Celerinatantimonas diazotrophica]CAG9296103.1 Nicotinate phosphoribosyltransferase 2 [Celerinatantimonas diazotrophica]